MVVQERCYAFELYRSRELPTDDVIAAFLAETNMRSRNTAMHGLLYPPSSRERPPCRVDQRHVVCSKNLLKGESYLIADYDYDYDYDYDVAHKCDRRKDRQKDRQTHTIMIAIAASCGLLVFCCNSSSMTPIAHFHCRIAKESPALIIPDSKSWVLGNLASSLVSSNKLAS